MTKIVRNVVLAATMLAGFSGASFASLITAPVPMPAGMPRG
ncbi:hypothetical protein HNQ77_003413 [Silvibacterium bohemicum]|uniref:BA14K family protein n=1 Tax=Silvibacterium bohemicum TaxID=1577686 RepID=A0A841JVN8_9BACT|nr:hypothetical protein [Silvibacterium bohemicum]MBB6145452.1 hypothetical protein [Silvibacterium bohemicum]